MAEDLPALSAEERKLLAYACTHHSDGLREAEVIRLFLRQVVAARGLPFEVREYPNAVTQAAMLEAREARARCRSSRQGAYACCGWQIRQGPG